MSDGLKAEERALEPARARKLLRAICEESDWECLRVLEARAIKRRPGRRLVVRYNVEFRRRGERPRSGRVFAKLYRGRHGESVHATMRRLRSAAEPPLQIPEAFGYSPRWRTLVLEALEGPTLSELVRLPDAPRYMASVADGLAILHGLQPEEATGDAPEVGLERHHGAAAEAEVLARARERVAATPFAPEIDAAFHALLDRVTELLAVDERVESSNVIHRDLHPEQIFICQGRLGLVDLDEACRGERELDLGNLIAHLVLADLQRTGRVGPARLAIETLLERCHALHALDEERLAIWEGASLLRLASLDRLSRPETSVLDRESLAGNLVAETRRILREPSPA